MRLAMRYLGTLALLAVLPSCGDSESPGMDFGGDEIGPDRHSIVGEDGEVKMGLTDEYVYFSLSDETLEEARSEMRRDADEEGASGFVGGVLEKTVGRALGFRARLPVSEIDEIRWEDGRMRIVFTDSDRSFGDNLSIEDRPVTESFTEEDVRAFAAAFRQVKAGAGADGATEVDPGADGATDSQPGADSTASW